MNNHLADGSLELPVYIEASPYSSVTRVPGYPVKAANGENGGIFWIVSILGLLVLVIAVFYWFGRKK